MKLTTNCPICEKALILSSEITMGDKILKQYKCGHSFTDQKLQEHNKPVLNFTNVAGTKRARPYQEVGVEFIINSGFACTIGDQMRLGKTPQALIALKNSDRFPALILVRAANMWQWLHETKDWITNGNPLGVYIINDTKGIIPPGFQIYIMSMDTFSTRGKCKSCNHRYHDESCAKCIKDGKSCKQCVPAGDAMSDRLLNFGFKLVIVDEAHSFKNTDSNRSQALTAFLKEIERSEMVQEIPFNCMMCKNQWMETITIKIQMGDATKRTTHKSFCPKCFAEQSQSAAAHVKVTRKCGIVMLTGTAIKNRADEYFVPLNLCAPEKFPSLESFRRSWLVKEGSSYKKVSPYVYDAFKKAIAPYVLRREKEDVYKEVPKLNRIFTIIEITDERLKKAYNKVLDEIAEDSVSIPNYKMFDSIGKLQQLRQICGLAKVPFIADYVETFLSDSDNAKLAIGIHHHSVRDNLSELLSSYGTLKLSGQDSPERKYYLMKHFETSPEQVMIINMLAGGVGMDFHYVDYALIAERQWSSADEEQFEFRFYNPDTSIKDRPTNLEYIIAKGTVDEFFYDLIEEKRVIFGETIGTQWSINNDQGSFKKLIDRTLNSRL